MTARRERFRYLARRRPVILNAMSQPAAVTGIHFAHLSVTTELSSVNSDVMGAGQMRNRRYVAYYRVSTAKQGHSGLGLKPSVKRWLAI